METIRGTALSLALALTLASTSVAAQEAPDAPLRNASAQFLGALKQDAGLAGDPSRIDDLFRERMAPVFDFSLMTQLAMAHNWRLASARQQERLTAEFKPMVLRSYSAMLAGHQDCAVTYQPSHFMPRDTDATVHSEAKQCAGARKLDYEMTRTPDGWKVYDVKIAGASLVTRYRGIFATTVHDSGIDGLIRTLAEQNRQGVAMAKGAM